jgi:hypothetical protein
LIDRHAERLRQIGSELQVDARPGRFRRPDADVDVVKAALFEDGSEHHAEHQVGTAVQRGFHARDQPIAGVGVHVVHLRHPVILCRHETAHAARASDGSTGTGSPYNPTHRNPSLLNADTDAQ